MRHTAHPAARPLSTGTSARCSCGLTKNSPCCDGSHTEGNAASAPLHAKVRQTRRA